MSSSGSLHDSPAADDLLDAVREWIERDLVPALGGRLQFHARVAANVLAMVAREIVLGPAQRRDHEARLAALGCADDAELAARIRTGDFDGRLAEVVSAVEADVADKLSVANPRYFADS